MKKGKTKLLVAIIVILVIVIAVIAGAYVYLETDLFKSNDQLFIKYLAKNAEVIEAFSEKNEVSLLDNFKQYKETSEITFNLESNDSQIASTIPASNFSIKSTANVDNINEMSSRETTLKYANEDLFTLKYLRNGDLYALKSDEVINKYLAFENNNLKELAAKYEIADVSMIPDKIKQVDLNELFKLTEEQKNAIIQKYLPVIISRNI